MSADAIAAGVLAGALLVVVLGFLWAVFVLPDPPGPPPAPPVDRG